MKTLVILGLAALTATSAMTMQTTSAEAGRGFRLGVGIGLGVGLAMQHRHHRRHVYRAPVYTEKYRAPRAAAPVVASAPVFADGRGREYDPTTRVWFDGKNACWTGSQKWTFKRGAWFFGSNRWYESGGAWQTNVDGEPVPVDCKASPLFAAKIDKSTVKRGNEYSEARGTGNTARSGESPMKTAVKPEETAKDSPLARECKKYFPAVGESVSVPCT